MPTAELVIVQAIDHFNGDTSSHVKREEVLIQRRYRLLLLDHGSIAAVIMMIHGYRSAKLHVCVV